MPTFYFTFGYKYHHEPHPSGRKCNPDGYIAVVAEDSDSARDKMFAAYGKYWAMMYDTKPDLNTFPYGEIDSI